MTNTEINIPLLRKAVEWAEAENAKPRELCEWNQDTWSVTNPQATVFGEYDEEGMWVSYAKDQSCGTCFCIAGYIAHLSLAPNECIEGSLIYRNGRLVGDVPVRAAHELGIVTDRPGHLLLFSAGNDIHDVRRIAEELAGERL